MQGVAFSTARNIPILIWLKYVPLFTERVKLQLRDELFNALNQVNFNDPTTKAPSSTFGYIYRCGSWA